MHCNVKASSINNLTNLPNVAKNSVGLIDKSEFKPWQFPVSKKLCTHIFWAVDNYMRINRELNFKNVKQILKCQGNQTFILGLMWDHSTSLLLVTIYKRLNLFIDWTKIISRHSAHKNHLKLTCIIRNRIFFMVYFMNRSKRKLRLSLITFFQSNNIGKLMLEAKSVKHLNFDNNWW